MPVFDKKDKSRYTTFTRRGLGLAGGMSAVFAVLAGRLYELQIRDGEEYKAEAEENRTSETALVPPRGRIMDRFGVELANNKRNYRVLIVSELATEGVAATLDIIGKVIALSDQQKKRVLHDVAQNKTFARVPVVEDLTWDEFSRVSLHLPYLPGVQLDAGQTRDYPFSKEMVHVLGMSLRSRLKIRQPMTISCWICQATASASAAWKRHLIVRCAGRRAIARSRLMPMAALFAHWVRMMARLARMSG